MEFDMEPGLHKLIKARIEDYLNTLNADNLISPNYEIQVTPGEDDRQINVKVIEHIPSISYTITVDSTDGTI